MFHSLFLTVQLMKTSKADLTRDLTLKSWEFQSGTTRNYRNKLDKESFRLQLRKKKSLHHKEKPTWEQISQGGCTVSGAYHGLTGHSPEQPGFIPELTLVWAGSWTRDVQRYYLMKQCLFYAPVWLLFNNLTAEFGLILLVILKYY